MRGQLCDGAWNVTTWSTYSKTKTLKLNTIWWLHNLFIETLRKKKLFLVPSIITHQDTNSLKPGCWPRPPVNYCILISLALKSSLTGSLKVQQIYSFTRSGFEDLTPTSFKGPATQMLHGIALFTFFIFLPVLSQRALSLLSDGSRWLEEHHQTQLVLQQQLP